MMGRNLVTRLLAVAMLVASPAIGGQVLPMLHPCPVAEEGAGHEHAGHGGHDVPSQDAEHCICIGSCAAAATVAVPDAMTVVVQPQLPEEAKVAPVGSRDTAPAHHPPLDLLPPPTAPPLA